MKYRISIRALCMAMALALGAGAAWAEQQELHFPVAPAWYYVSLQVHPDQADPIHVFPTTDPEFAYQHLWSWKPWEGWRHYTPLDGVLGNSTLINDLGPIEALQGYWIYVTKVPAEGKTLAVQGTPASSQLFVIPPNASSDDAWYSFGPLLHPGSQAKNLTTAFADASAALTDVVEDLWRYDRVTQDFSEISNYTANCNQAPEECLAPGEAYWVRLNQDVLLGSEFDVIPSSVTLTPEAPFQRLQIFYRGVGETARMLRIADAGSGLVFIGARPQTVQLDGNPNNPSIDQTLYEPDLDITQLGGPDASCGDLCEGEQGCLTLCFENSLGVPGQDFCPSQLDCRRSYTVFIGMALDEMIEMADDPEVSGLETGREAYATLKIDEGPNSLTDFAIPVAVKPVLVSGEYAGVLSYDEKSFGTVPINLYLDADDSDLTAVINPRLQASASNGIDDDGDGDLDEEGEDHVVRRWDTPAFATQYVLQGSVAEGGALLRLRGDPAEFAREAPTAFCCDGDGSENDTCPVLSDGQCSDRSGSCVHDLDCPRDAGVFSSLASQDPTQRTLELEARRLDTLTFAGSFVDRIEQPTSTQQPLEPRRGTIVLEKVRGPQCVVHDTPEPGGDPVRSLPLGIPCRMGQAPEESDCPFRCDPTTSGNPDLAGLACNPSASPTGCSCVAIPCQFYEYTSAGFVDAELYVSVDVTLNGVAFTPLVIEILGLEGSFHTIDSPDETLNLGLVPCGSRTLLLSSPSCGTQSVQIDVCDVDGNALYGAGSPVDIDITCDDEIVAENGDTGAGAGAITVTGGVVLGAAVGENPGDTATGGELAAVARDPVQGWTDRLHWPPVVEELRSGLFSWLIDSQEGGE